MHTEYGCSAIESMKKAARNP